jgi:hypothetical protein
MPGMLLHIDGSQHRWLNDDRWYDLIVILDDATSEIYYAQLMDKESTATVMAAIREVVERKGLFCALYSDRGSHFWLTPKAGGKVDPHQVTQLGRALPRSRRADDSGLLATGAWPLGTQLRNLAAPAAARTALAQNHHHRRGKSFPARALCSRIQPPLSGTRCPASMPTFKTSPCY